MLLFPLPLTSVGHEDFYSCVLQEVASGENCPNLTEHPLPVQTLGVGQDLKHTERISLCDSLIKSDFQDIGSEPETGK